MTNLITQSSINLGPSGGFRGFGKIGLEGQGTGQNSANIFAQVISTTIGTITVVAIVWFVIQLLIGAVSIISSGGDKAKAEAARNKITSALTGLVVVIAGIFILSLVGSILGLPNILDLGHIIENLKF